MKELIDKIESLTDSQRFEVGKYIDYILWKNEDVVPVEKKDHVTEVLNKIPPAQVELDKKISQELVKKFKTDWKFIKEKSVLTLWLAEQMKQMKNPQLSGYDAKRVYGDGRTGYFFEDKFSLLLKMFLLSKHPEWSSKTKLNIEVNAPLKVPGMAIQKPDVKITLGRKQTPDVILELKSSWSKSTVKNAIKEQKAKWDKVSENIKFLFVIFSASEKKSKTYSNAEYCKVICKNFSTSIAALKKGLVPVPVNPIEEIFEEIEEELTKRKQNKK